MHKLRTLVQIRTVLIQALILFVLAFPNAVFAQENPETNSSQTPTYSRTVIIQTDLEENLANQSVICTQSSKSLEIIDPADVVTHEYTSNQAGEITITTQSPESAYYMCSVPDTTPDYCWYFPFSTYSFEIYSNEDKNTPIYIAGISTGELCNKEFTQAELEQGILSYLPEGFPQPPKNKNLYPSPPVPVIAENIVEDAPSELTLWQWLLFKIKTLFK